MKIRVDFRISRFRRLYSSQASRSGTILIFALVILAVGAIAMTGWVYLMGGLTEYTDAMREGVKRRVTMENSRAMSNQYIREYLRDGSARAARTNFSVVSGTYALGGVGIPAVSANPLTATNAYIEVGNCFSPAGVSYSGTAPFSGYSQDLTVSLSDGIDQVPWRMRVRSRAPVFGHDVINLLGMSSLPSSVLVPDPNALGSSVGPRTSAGLLNVTFPPEVPDTVTHVVYTGTSVNLGGSTIGVTSFSSTEANGDHTSDNNRRRRLWTGTTGNIATIYLNRDPVPGTPSARIYRITGTDTRQVVLSADTGTSAVAITNLSAAPPILILVASAYGSSGGTGTNNLYITVPRGNQRRVYLSVDSRFPFTTAITGASSGSTRLAATFGGTLFGGTSRPTIVLPANHTVVGGFRTGATSVSVSGGTLSILRETASLPVLENMASRRGWVETYRND